MISDLEKGQLLQRIWHGLTNEPQSVAQLAAHLDIPAMHVRLMVGILEGQGRAVRHMRGNLRLFTHREPPVLAPRATYRPAPTASRYEPRQEAYISFNRRIEE